MEAIDCVTKCFVTISVYVSFQKQARFLTRTVRQQREPSTHFMYSFHRGTVANIFNFSIYAMFRGLSSSFIVQSE